MLQHADVPVWGTANPASQAGAPEPKTNAPSTPAVSAATIGHEAQTSIGLAEVPLGVLALAAPGATLAALVTVAGIWAVVIGATRVVLAFELRHLPKDIDKALAVRG